MCRFTSFLFIACSLLLSSVTVELSQPKNIGLYSHEVSLNSNIHNDDKAQYVPNSRFVRNESKPDIEPSTDNPDRVSSFDLVRNYFEHKIFVAKLAQQRVISHINPPFVLNGWRISNLQFRFGHSRREPFVFISLLFLNL